MTSPEAPASVPAPEPSSSEQVPETRYTLSLSTGALSEATEEEALQALATVLTGTAFNVDLVSGEHQTLKAARESDPFVGVGGFIVDLVGDTMPSIDIWNAARAHLLAAGAALSARDVVGAAGRLSEADSAYRDAVKQWQAYKDQLADAGVHAIVGIVAVAVVLSAAAVVVFAAAPAAAAGGGAAGGGAAGGGAAGGGAAGGSTLPGLGAPSAAQEAAVALTQPVNPLAMTGPAVAPTLPGAAAVPAGGAAVGGGIAAPIAVAETLPGAAAAASAAAGSATSAVASVSVEAGVVVSEVGAAIAAGGESAGLEVAMTIGANPAGRALLEVAAEAAGLAAARLVATYADQQLLQQINFVLTRAFVLLESGGTP